MQWPRSASWKLHYVTLPHSSGLCCGSVTHRAERINEVGIAHSSGAPVPKAEFCPLDVISNLELQEHMFRVSLKLSRTKHFFYSL